MLALFDIYGFLLFYDHRPKVFDNVFKFILYSIVFTLLGAQWIAWQLTMDWTCYKSLSTLSTYRKMSQCTGGGGFSAKFRLGGCRPQFQNVTVG